MKFLLFNLTMLFSLTALCQTKSNLHSKWEIGLNFSPDYSYRKQTYNYDIGVAQLMKLNQPRFGFTTGINVLYMLGNHFGIETGIGYAQKGYGSKKGEKYESFQHSLNEPELAYYNRKYGFIEIPLKFVYKSQGNNVRFISSVGVIADLMITSRAYTEYIYPNGNKISWDKKTKDAFHPITIVPFVSAGAEINMGTNLKMRVEPVFRFSSMRMEKKSITETSTYLWTAGLNIGLYYSL